MAMLARLMVMMKTGVKSPLEFAFYLIIFLILKLDIIRNYLSSFLLLIIDEGGHHFQPCGTGPSSSWLGEAESGGAGGGNADEADGDDEDWSYRRG